jgi:hypothetical protein
MGAGGGNKKGRQHEVCLQGKEEGRSNVGLGLAQTLHAVASLPLAALLEQIDALEALEDVAFHDEAGDALEAFVLGHGG